MASIDEVMGKDLKSISSQTNAMPPADPSKILKLAEDRIGEAIQIYSKFSACAVLESSLTLKFARLIEILTPKDDSDYLTKAVESVMRAVAVSGLSTVQQIECIVEGSLIFKRLGMTRKCALLSYIAALMSSEGQTLEGTRDLVCYLIVCFIDFRLFLFP